MVKPRDSNTVLVCGPFADHKSCWNFKLDTFSVATEQTMRYGHSLGAMVVYKENPIILGGLDKSNNSVSGVEIWLEYWASQDDLPQPVYLHSALVANYEVTLYRPFNQTPLKNLNHILTYLLARLKPLMSLKFNKPVSPEKVVIFQTICVFGGIRDGKATDFYFWNEGNGWEFGGHLKRPRYGHTSFAQVSLFVIIEFQLPLKCT